RKRTAGEAGLVDDSTVEDERAHKTSGGRSSGGKGRRGSNASSARSGASSSASRSRSKGKAGGRSGPQEPTVVERQQAREAAGRRRAGQGRRDRVRRPLPGDHGRHPRQPLLPQGLRRVPRPRRRAPGRDVRTARRRGQAPAAPEDPRRPPEHVPAPRVAPVRRRPRRRTRRRVPVGVLLPPQGVQRHGRPGHGAGGVNNPDGGEAGTGAGGGGRTS
ncbi:hypothetical protein THAOC_04720, partial [Thalassiosira oceanica]